MSHIRPARLDPYANFAPFYNDFTRTYDHLRWLRRLEQLARRHGLDSAQRRVLDVACGTGKSLRPLLALGYEGEGCDVSRAMLREAVTALPGVRFFEADMRSLRVNRRYGWITCINDALNHLLTTDDLKKAVASMAGALEPRGLLTFDVNTLMAHRSGVEATFVVDRSADAMWVWRGRGHAGGRGDIGMVDIDLFERHCHEWSRVTTRQHSRWWSDAAIEAAAEAAGLVIVGRYGQRPGAIVEEHLDEACHTKVVYFLRRRELDPCQRRTH